jgi:hypothetical protein
MRVSFSLLTDSQEDGTSPWDAVAIVLHVFGAMDRLMMYVAECWNKRHPLSRSVAEEVLVFAPELGRSRFLVQQGIGIDQPMIVARVSGDGSHPRLGPALILREAQRESFVDKMAFRTGCDS